MKALENLVVGIIEDLFFPELARRRRQMPHGDLRD